jgi:hypothetical protein
MVRSCHCGCPALLTRPSDNLAEEDPVHNAQWRPADRTPHAHHPLRDAEQVEAIEEAHVLLLRGVPEARCTRKAPTGVDSGLVGVEIEAYELDTNCGTAMPSVSTYKRPTNTYEETHCASCMHLHMYSFNTWLIINSTKLRDAELVEPLLRKLGSGSTQSLFTNNQQNPSANVSRTDTHMSERTQPLPWPASSHISRSSCQMLLTC